MTPSPDTAPAQRRIIHVDMDAFYASVEQRDDHRKPDGLFVITPRMGPGFVEALPVGKFHGIGPKTAARMSALGIHTGLGLRGQSRAFLTEHFGKAGDYLYGVARGVDDRPVQADRVRKSVGPRQPSSAMSCAGRRSCPHSCRCSSGRDKGHAGTGQPRPAVATLSVTARGASARGRLVEPER